jgi:hypothetical protein
MILWTVIAWPIAGHPDNAGAKMEAPMNFTSHSDAKRYVREMGAKHFLVEVRPAGRNKADVMDDAHARIWAWKRPARQKQ